ncbi:hypothetical protein E2C01_026640 [Portunus trituberculatus]|uniref:Uncharacterized protein n=1 Tax=Portunus trituberculatus TaxID=210409 RepID=A0A5B7EJB8_PORTR|nr:hypothetical protein [Portunus trituberculatus]
MHIRNAISGNKDLRIIVLLKQNQEIRLGFRRDVAPRLKRIRKKMEIEPSPEDAYKRLKNNNNNNNNLMKTPPPPPPQTTTTTTTTISSTITTAAFTSPSACRVATSRRLLHQYICREDKEVESARR